MTLFLRHLFAAATLCCAGAASADIKLGGVENCVVQLPIAGQTQAIVFATVNNFGSMRNLVKVHTDQNIERTFSLHEMKNHDGVVEMSPVEKIPTPTGITELKKGGYHVMLEDFKPSDEKMLEDLRLNFTFVSDHGSKVVCTCHPQIVSAKEMMQAAEDDHSDHAHHHHDTKPSDDNKPES